MIDRDVVHEMARGVDRAFVNGSLESLFKDRISAKLSRTLIAAGLDSPERLLFMPLSAVEALPGVGRAGLTEIQSYRSKYLDQGA